MRAHPGLRRAYGARGDTNYHKFSRNPDQAPTCNQEMQETKGGIPMVDVEGKREVQHLEGSKIGLFTG